MTKFIKVLTTGALAIAAIMPIFAQQATQSTVISETAPTLAPSALGSVVSVPRLSLGVELLGIGHKATLQFEQPIGNYAIGGYATYNYGSKAPGLSITGQGVQLSPYFRYYRGNGKGFYAQGKTILAWQQGPTMGGFRGHGHHDSLSVAPAAISSEAAHKNHFGFGGGLALGYKNTFFGSRFYYDANIGVSYIQGLPRPSEPVKTTEGEGSGTTNTNTTSPNGQHKGHHDCDGPGLGKLFGPGSLIDANVSVGYKF